MRPVVHLGHFAGFTAPLSLFSSTSDGFVYQWKRVIDVAGCEESQA